MVKQGDFVKFRPSYIEAKRMQFRGRNNLTEIMVFFNGKHRVLRIVSEDTLVLHCPRGLGIGATPGFWRPSEDKVIVCPKEKHGPCKCEWKHCRNHKVEQVKQES